MGKILFFVTIFLIIGGYMIYSDLNTDFDDSDDTKSFIVEFGKWVWQLGKSTSKTVGYASQQEWLPDVNDSNVTNSSDD